jgi:hypothetical protein
LGAVLGIIYNSISPEAAQNFSNKIKILATIFIQIGKLLSPLVLQLLL